MKALDNTINKDENSKQKILKIAMKLFAEKGFDGVSVREICKKATVNLCMVSYYFGGKKELYQAIIDDLIQKQSEYAKTFVDLDLDLSNMQKQELIKLLHIIIDKMVDFGFTSVSKELTSFLILEQQKQNAIVSPPMLLFVKKIFAKIFNKNENDKDIIFKVLFLMGNIITPKVFLHFSLSTFKQDDFNNEDLKLIKENAHRHIDTLTKGIEFD